MSCHYLSIKQGKRKLVHIVAAGCWLSMRKGVCGAWCRQASELLCCPASSSTQATLSQVHYGRSELTAPLIRIAHLRSAPSAHILGDRAFRMISCTDVCSNFMQAQMLLAD